MKTFVKAAVLFVILSTWAALLLRPAEAGAWPQAWMKEQESEAAASGQSARGMKLFDDKCARCHGADGRGRTVIGGILGVPDFTDEKWWGEEKSESRFVNSITNGKGEMPAFGRKLSRREISTLAAYVRGFRKADH